MAAKVHVVGWTLHRHVDRNDAPRNLERGNLTQRLDAFKLNRIGAFAEGAVNAAQVGRPRGGLLARQAPNILINGNPVLVVWDEQGRRFECTACGGRVTLAL